MITLYHGSNIKIGKIDLSRCKKGKDFRCGFYLNVNREQAEAMAQRTTRMLGEGAPTVSEFAFDDNAAAADGLNIKVFPEYSEEWADFVVKNRKNDSDTPAHPFDIVIGPIADDTVGVQIRRFVMGVLSAPELVEELRFRGNHAVQYFFGNPEAIKYLKPRN